MSAPAPEPLPALPSSLKAERQGTVALLRLARPEKRNALDDALGLGIEAFFVPLPAPLGRREGRGGARRRRAFLDRSRPRRVDQTRHGRAHRAFADVAPRFC